MDKASLDRNRMVASRERIVASRARILRFEDKDKGDDNGGGAAAAPSLLGDQSKSTQEQPTIDDNGVFYVEANTSKKREFEKKELWKIKYVERASEEEALLVMPPKRPRHPRARVPVHMLEKHWDTGMNDDVKEAAKQKALGGRDVGTKKSHFEGGLSVRTSTKKKKAPKKAPKKKTGIHGFGK